MTIITANITEPGAEIGGKAKNLFRLKKIGITVPNWAVIPQSVLINQLPSEASPELVKAAIEQAKVPAIVLDELKTYFGDQVAEKTFAVRSSAIDEDGASHSFAGQFETLLHIPFNEIESAIKRIWESVTSERILAYRKQNNLPTHYGIGVIVQVMVSPTVAGVGFGLNPLNNDTSTKIVSAVYGLGEGLVSGELDADTYEIRAKDIKKTIVEKTRQFKRKSTGSGIEKVDVPLALQKTPALRDEQLRAVEKILNRLEEELGSPQDIEFAIDNDILYLLQTRPITTTAKEEEEYILWDNSNIIESYPGITTPLTFTFITKMYEMVYCQFVGLLGVNQREIEAHKNVFANTLGLVRGRVYYNLLSWYKMLAMVPGYSINAEFMENMMGVKERFELKENYRMSKGLATLRIIGMIFKMIRLQRRLPKERKRFKQQLQAVMATYQQYDFSTMKAAEIVRHYQHFETTLLLKWKAPLINDFFAMIWFGMLQKKTAKLCPNEPNLHNDLLCGSNDIISVEPIHRSMDIAKLILQNNAAAQLFKTQKADVIWQTLLNDEYPAIKKQIDDYIERFGNRCVGELKLETISYEQDPTLFISVIKSYVIQGITARKANENVEEELRTKAEVKIKKALNGKPLKRWWFNYILKKARDLVSNRENLRYERTRGFGMVRKMVTALGDELHNQKHLNHSRDIFYMELDEILELASTEFKPEINKRIVQRKKEFEAYATERAPEERFFTDGMNFTDDYIYSKEKIQPIVGDLKGTGCCPGRVKGKVRVVKHPNEIDSLDGDILVTTSTDPGWVTLFPTAGAIIVERGSMLSHSAIVSREMGIPCIVSVTGLLRTLKTGDEIQMDGATGEIQLITK